VVDDAPTSPNMKEANWAVMQPMLSAFKEQFMSDPELLILALEYSPLPAAFVDALKKTFAKKQQTDPGQQQWQETMKQLAISKLVAEINKDQSTAEMQNAKAGGTTSTATYDLAMAQNLMAKNDVAGFEHHIDAMSTAAKAELDRAKAHQALIDAHNTMQQGNIDREQHASNMMNDATDRAVARHGAAVETHGAMIDRHTAETARHKALTDRIQAHLTARQQQLDAQQMQMDQNNQQAERELQRRKQTGDQGLKGQQLRQQDEHNRRTSDIARFTAMAGALQGPSEGQQ